MCPTTSQPEHTPTQLCQSIITSGFFGTGEYACTIEASTVLFGVHLCGTHKLAWEQRLKRGEKIRIHHTRALPVDHQCAPPPPPDMKVCAGPCGQAKPLSEFYLSRGKYPMTMCRRCWNQRTSLGRQRRHAREVDVVAVPTTTADEPKATAAPEPPPARPGLEVWLKEVDRLPPPHPHNHETAQRLTSRLAQVTVEVAAVEQDLDHSVDVEEPEDEPGAPSFEGWRADDATEQDEEPSGTLSYVYQVEFVCLLCGRWIADVETAKPKDVVITPEQRCKVCGGAPIRSGEVNRKFAPELPVQIDRPTRGRGAVA